MDVSRDDVHDGTRLKKLVKASRDASAGKVITEWHTIARIT